MLFLSDQFFLFIFGQGVFPCYSRFRVNRSTLQLINRVNPYRLAMSFGNRNFLFLEDLFSAILAQFKKYHPSGNLKFNYLGIFQSSKLRIL